MKKNSIQKVLAVTIAGVMTAGTLTACGNSGSSDASSSAADSSSAAESTAAESSEAGSEAAAADDGATGIDSWEAFADNVTLKVPVYDRGAEGVPDVTNNYWTQWVQENFGDKYNVTVEYVPITRSDVMTDYALLASSNSLPTILMEYDYPKTSQWANDGYLTTFDMDEFAKVAPTYYARMVEQNQLDYSVMDGDTYFVLAERPYSATSYGWQTFVRMDWLEQVGYDHVPMTREEYLDAMQKIMDAGICDHPGGGAKLAGSGIDQNQIWRTFPLDEKEWAMYGDYNIVSMSWEPNKLLLKAANEEYNLGITNPEYYVTDAETAKANFVNGKQYSYGMYINQSADVLKSLWENQPDAKLAIVPADAVYGSAPAWRADNPFGMIVGFSSSATEDEIKAAWMYMEWLNQPENLFTLQWGIEGENFNYNEEGLPVSVSDYDGEYKQGYSYSADYYCIVTSARNAGTIEQIIANSFPQDFDQSAELTQEVIDYYYKRVELAKEGYATVDCMFSTVIDAESEYRDTLVSKYVEYRDKLTMCDPSEFDSLYDQYAQEYLDAGYQEIIDERAQAYEDGKTTKLPANN